MLRPSGSSSGTRKKGTRRKGLPYPTTVLIVDDDLGFLWWLGDILGNSGCTVVPALSCQQAVTFMKELSVNLDLIFVNPGLSGVSSMLESLTAGQNKIKVIEVPRSADDILN